MTLADPSTARSARRRPSLPLRARPRTSVPELTQTAAPWTMAGAWSSYQTGHDDRITSFAERPAMETGNRQNHGEDHNGQVFEETSAFPEPAPRRRSSRSFSTLLHGVDDGLRALGRRLSVSIRKKSSRHNMQVHQEDARPEDRPAKFPTVGSTGDGRSRNAWFRGPSINRRPSLHSVSALQTFYAPTGNPAGIGLEPPVFAGDLSQGDAARAAAAAQNEMAKAEREDSKIFDKDSESGIEIDLRDRSELSDEELAVVRIGKHPLEDCSLVARWLIGKFRSGAILSRRNHGPDPVVSRPRVSHAGRVCLPCLEGSRVVASRVAACLPPGIRPPSTMRDKEEDSVCRSGQDLAQSRLEEDVFRAAGSGTPMERGEGRCHLPQRPSGQCLLCPIR